MSNDKDPMKTTGVIIGVIVLIAIIFGVVAVISSPADRPLVIEYVRDNSSSTPPSDSCVKEIVKDILGKASDEVEFRYTKTGDGTTAFEPVQDVQPFKVKKSDIAWGDGPDKAEEMSNEFLSHITSQG